MAQPVMSKCRLNIEARWQIEKPIFIVIQVKILTEYTSDEAVNLHHIVSNNVVLCVNTRRVAIMSIRIVFNYKQKVFPYR